MPGGPGNSTAAQRVPTAYEEIRKIAGGAEPGQSDAVAPIYLGCLEGVEEITRAIKFLGNNLVSCDITYHSKTTSGIMTLIMYIS